MTNKHVETLRELIERWRKESDDFERDGDEGSAASYYNCADELEGVIALMRGQSEPVELTDNEKIAMQVMCLELVTEMRTEMETNLTGFGIYPKIRAMCDKIEALLARSGALECRLSGPGGRSCA